MIHRNRESTTFGIPNIDKRRLTIEKREGLGDLEAVFVDVQRFNL